MPNGKGSSEWGCCPSAEETFVALVTFAITLLICKNLALSIGSGFVAGVLMLWANNGWPGIRR